MVVAGIAISDLDSSCFLQWLTKKKVKTMFSTSRDGSLEATGPQW